MYAVNYHRASSVADAAKMQKKGDDAKYLSGGMTLIPAMKTRLAAPSDLVEEAFLRRIHYKIHAESPALRKRGTRIVMRFRQAEKTSRTEPQ